MALVLKKTFAVKYDSGKGEKSIREKHHRFMILLIFCAEIYAIMMEFLPVLLL